MVTMRHEKAVKQQHATVTVLAYRGTHTRALPSITAPLRHCSLRSALRPFLLMHRSLTALRGVLL